MTVRRVDGRPAADTSVACRRDDVGTAWIAAIVVIARIFSASAYHIISQRREREKGREGLT